MINKETMAMGMAGSMLIALFAGVSATGDNTEDAVATAKPVATEEAAVTEEAAATEEAAVTEEATAEAEPATEEVAAEKVADVEKTVAADDALTTKESGTLSRRFILGLCDAGFRFGGFAHL